MHPDIRPAEPTDVPHLLRLIRELAVYEREPDAVATTEADLTAALFPEDGSPTAFCHVAEAGEGRGRRVVGMALWFLTFSTWTGRTGMHLEDLFVEPEHRGTGLGKALLATLAQVCTDRGLPRLEWTVLNWNTPAIDFYDSLGARPQSEWTTYRLTAPALDDVASVTRPAPPVP